MAFRDSSLPCPLTLALASFVLACTPTPAATTPPSDIAEGTPLAPIETEPTPIGAPTNTGVAEPTEVYYGWADGKGVTFSVSNLSSAEYDVFANTGLDSERPLKPNDPRIPARFAVGSSFVVVSEQGRTQGRVERIRVFWGASELHFEVELALEAPLTGERGLLVLPLDKAPADIHVRIPEPLDPSEPVFATILANAGEATKKAGGPPPTKDELQVHRVALANEGSFVFSFRALGGRNYDDVIAEDLMSGYGIADSSGTIIEWIHPAAPRLDSFDTLLLLDLEGDGVDELIYDSSYYEGAYQLLLYRIEDYSGGKYQQVVLAGDGA